MYFHKVAHKIARRMFETYALNLINRCEREPAMNDHERGDITHDHILTRPNQLKTDGHEAIFEL